MIALLGYDQSGLTSKITSGLARHLASDDTPRMDGNMQKPGPLPAHQLQFKGNLLQRRCPASGWTLYSVMGRFFFISWIWPLPVL